MNKENSDIQMGEVPALLFIPGSLPPGGSISAESILVISTPTLYVYARDIVIADRTARHLQENDYAATQLMQELLKYKPNLGKKSSSDTSFSDSTFFNIEEWLKGDGSVVRDNEP
ncbi:MAG: hypothetical protein A2173_01965 [Planctomycetes bacterium RBG_13_44_8b]|nr:MAG: hypothetical protein A2173_01965 [Planctomycetes bacterium RBG_13_44_8b]